MRLFPDHFFGVSSEMSRWVVSECWAVDSEIKAVSAVVGFELVSDVRPDTLNIWKVCCFLVNR